MRAVLINNASVRLGWKHVADDTRVIEFGGAVFAMVGDGCFDVVLDDGSTGIAFEQTVIEVVRDLDCFDPTRRAR